MGRHNETEEESRGAPLRTQLRALDNEGERGEARTEFASASEEARAPDGQNILFFCFFFSGRGGVSFVFPLGCWGPYYDRFCRSVPGKMDIYKTHRFAEQLS